MAVDDELANIASMFERGLLTPEEFAQAKSAILESGTAAPEAANGNGEGHACYPCGNPRRGFSGEYCEFGLAAAATAM